MIPTSRGPALASPAPSSRAVGQNTVGAMVLSAAHRHSGVALQFKRDGAFAYIS